MGKTTLLCCVQNLVAIPEGLCLGHSSLLEQQSNTSLQEGLRHVPDVTTWGPKVAELRAWLLGSCL